MITDAQTNAVYFSSLLKSQYSNFWNDLEVILKKHSIKYDWIHHTNDIWCRDYMPIQITENEYVQFKFFPDYYLDYSYISLLTLQYEIEYNQMGYDKFINLVVDGGNVVRSKNKAIMTEKVFLANKNRDKKTVIDMIKKALRINDLFFIPVQPYDLSGHSDGMVRFYNDSTLLVNEFFESSSWMNRLNLALLKTRLKSLPFPFKKSPHKNRGEYTAHGCYINFAQIGKLIIFPQFGGEFSETDETALKRIKELYSDKEYVIETINCDSIAWDGGVLNCCTWNVSRPVIKAAIDKILPVYKLNDLILVILEDDYKGTTIDDTVCIQLFLKNAKYLTPWSMAKHLKFGDGFYDVSSPEEITEIRRLICSKFDEIDISDIYFKLKSPSNDVISELVSIPERLKKRTIN